MLQVAKFLLTLTSLVSFKPASSHHRNQSMTHGQHEDSHMSENSSGLSNQQNEHFLIRLRKTIDKNKVGFTESERKIILDLHNAERRNSGASNMMILKWDAALEKFAQAWASNCNFRHQEGSQKVGKFSVVGENLAATTNAGGYPAGAVTSWNAEKAQYSYDTNSCSGVCGHYTANVWAETSFVGCGIKYCDPLQINPWPGYFLVCNYGPGGNYVGQKPYKKGAACSECPNDAKHCIDGLCSTTPGSGSSGEMTTFSINLTCGYTATAAFIRVSAI